VLLVVALLRAYFGGAAFSLDSSSVLLVLGILLLGFVVLIPLFVGYVALRVRAALLKKRLAISSRVLRGLRSRYGNTIAGTRERYRTLHDARMKATGSVLRDRAATDQPNRSTDAFERTVPGAPVERHSEVFREMDVLVDDYLKMTEPERKALRYLVSRDEPVLRGYQSSATAVLEATKDRAWLLRGLAATSLEDCQTDFRDSIGTLDTLLKAAARLGIDWRPQVAAVARLSDDTEPLGGGEGTPWKSTKTYLEGRIQGEL
jgi:hypothetical protein